MSILRGLAIATVAVIVGSAGADAAEVICASKDGRPQYCPARTDGYVRLVKRYSGSPCVEGHSWGYDRGGVWVMRGCRAKFEVGRSHGGHRPPTAERVRCESRDGSYQHCRVDTHGYVRLERRLSNDPCVEDRMWGFDQWGIWVDRGCRADFLVGRHQLPQFPGNRFRTITCASDDRQYRYCRVDTGWHVRLSQRLSDTPCVQGRTWGFDEWGVWVDQGCRGRFTVGAPMGR